MYGAALRVRVRRRRRRGLHDPLRLHPCPPCPDPLRPGLHPLTPPPPPPFPIAPSLLRDRPSLQPAGLETELLKAHLLFVCTRGRHLDMGGPEPRTCRVPFFNCGEPRSSRSTRSTAWLGGSSTVPRVQRAGFEGHPGRPTGRPVHSSAFELQVPVAQTLLG